ncbi:MAG TPA: hypothetical protein VGG57_04695 [Stellaceae bacterium]|jgi:hypothetical protein
MPARDIGLQRDDVSDSRPPRVFDSADAALRFLRAQRTVKIATGNIIERGLSNVPDRAAPLDPWPWSDLAKPLLSRKIANHRDVVINLPARAFRNYTV